MQKKKEETQWNTRNAMQYKVLMPKSLNINVYLTLLNSPFSPVPRIYLVVRKGACIGARGERGWLMTPALTKESKRWILRCFSEDEFPSALITFDHSVHRYSSLFCNFLPGSCMCSCWSFSAAAPLFASPSRFSPASHALSRLPVQHLQFAHLTPSPVHTRHRTV